MSDVKLSLRQNHVRLMELVERHLWGDDRHHYANMLVGVAPDRAQGDDTYLGLLRAPAARGNHHAFEGGLVHHLLEMWDCWLMVRDKFLVEPYVTDARVLKAIINHDIHKAHLTYRLVTEDPWKVEYGHPSDSLTTTDFKSLQILSCYGIVLDYEQMNALQLAEGGFSNTQPKWCSVLAKVCYLLDEMSANVLARIEAKTFLDHRTPVNKE